MLTETDFTGTETTEDFPAQEAGPAESAERYTAEVETDVSGEAPAPKLSATFSTAEAEPHDRVLDALVTYKGGERDDWKKEWEGGGFAINGKEILDEKGEVWDKLLPETKQEVMEQWERGGSVIFVDEIQKPASDGGVELYVTHILIGEDRKSLSFRIDMTAIPGRTEEDSTPVHDADAHGAVHRNDFYISRFEQHTEERMPDTPMYAEARAAAAVEHSEIEGTEMPESTPVETTRGDAVDAGIGGKEARAETLPETEHAPYTEHAGVSEHPSTSARENGREDLQEESSVIERLREADLFAVIETPRELQTVAMHTFTESRPPSTDSISDETKAIHTDRPIFEGVREFGVLDSTETIPRESHPEIERTPVRAAEHTLEKGRFETESVHIPALEQFLKEEPLELSLLERIDDIRREATNNNGAMNTEASRTDTGAVFAPDVHTVRNAESHTPLERLETQSVHESHYEVGMRKAEHGNRTVEEMLSRVLRTATPERGFNTRERVYSEALSKLRPAPTSVANTETEHVKDNIRELNGIRIRMQRSA